MTNIRSVAPVRQWVAALAVVALLAGFLVVVAAGPAEAARSPFTGQWTSIDSSDGSSQRMSIGGGRAPRVNLYDNGASVCGLDGAGDPIFAARARGRGTSAGSMLSGTFSVTCLTRPPTAIGTFGFAFEYDAATDTLTDYLGETPTVWTRRGR